MCNVAQGNRPAQRKAKKTELQTDPHKSPAPSKDRGYETIMYITLEVFLEKGAMETGHGSVWEKILSPLGPAVKKNQGIHYSFHPGRDGTL